MKRTTDLVLAEDVDQVLGVLDVERLGRWVHFEATITERETEHGPQPVVSKLSATDDDGAVVAIGQSEHATIVMLFLQAFYRWRRSNVRVSSV